MEPALEFTPFFIDCDLTNELLQPTECGRSDAKPIPWLPTSASSSWNTCIWSPGLLTHCPAGETTWGNHVQRPLRMYGEGMRSSRLSVLAKPELLAEFNYMKDSKETTEEPPSGAPQHTEKWNNTWLLFKPLSFEAVSYAAQLTKYVTLLNHKAPNKKKVNWFP